MAVIVKQREQIDTNSLSQHSFFDTLAALQKQIFFCRFWYFSRRMNFKMVLFKVILILLISDITVPIISGLPNIVLILLDDVDIQLTGLKVCQKFYVYI